MLLESSAISDPSIVGQPNAHSKGSVGAKTSLEEHSDNISSEVSSELGSDEKDLHQSGSEKLGLEATRYGLKQGAPLSFFRHFLIEF